MWTKERFLKETFSCGGGKVSVSLRLLFLFI